MVYGDIKGNESGNVTKQLKADKDDEGDYPDNEKGSPNGEDVFLRLMQYLKDVHLILPIKLFKVKYLVKKITNHPTFIIFRPSIILSNPSRTT